VERSCARSGKFVLNSTGAPGAVDHHPQAVHRTVDAPPASRHDDLVLAPLLAAAALAGVPVLNPQHLPKLPGRGLAEWTQPGVALQTMRGRPLGLLPGLHLAEPRATHGLLLQDRRGRLLGYDPFERRLRPVFDMSTRYPGCRVPDATMRQDLLICGRHVDVVFAPPGVGSTRRVVARGRRGGGRWTWAEFSPSGRAILAQWSGECESPSAYLIADGRVRAYGRSDAVESVGLGWLPDGRAVVSFWSGVCGAGIPSPGVYAVPRRGKPELLRPTAGRAPGFAMWGG
jgi:hypothetical protein